MQMSLGNLSLCEEVKSLTLRFHSLLSYVEEGCELLSYDIPWLLFPWDGINCVYQHVTYRRRSSQYSSIDGGDDLHTSALAKVLLAVDGYCGMESHSYLTASSLVGFQCSNGWSILMHIWLVLIVLNELLITFIYLYIYYIYIYTQISI